MYRVASLKRWLFVIFLLPFCLGSCSPRVFASRAPAATPLPSHPTPSQATTPTTPRDPSPTPQPALSPTPAPSLIPTFFPSPSPTSTPTRLACWREGGQIEGASVPAGSLPEPLDFRVYLPPCYAEQPGRRYPVLYLIHGQSFNDDQWDRLGADETANRLIAEGEAVPFLIVMPRDRRWGQPDEDGFGKAVAEVLVPWIDTHYRTIAEREFRAVGGLSRGAGWAVHLALSRWELFGALGAHSLPVFWTDTYFIKEWLDAIPAGEMPRIYLDNPNNDRPEIMQSSIWFEKLLTQRGIAHEWYLFTGYHEERYWQAHVEQYLRWYVEEW